MYGSIDGRQRHFGAQVISAYGHTGGGKLVVAG